MIVIIISIIVMSIHNRVREEVSYSSFFRSSAEVKAPLTRENKWELGYLIMMDSKEENL
jgi:hypothetical protein